MAPHMLHQVALQVVPQVDHLKIHTRGRVTQEPQEHTD